MPNYTPPPTEEGPITTPAFGPGLNTLPPQIYSGEEGQYTRPEAMNAPSWIDFDPTLSNLQRRTALATRGISGESGTYRDQSAQDFYKNMFMRDFINQQGQLGQYGNVMPIEQQYMQQVMGLSFDPNMNSLMNAMNMGLGPGGIGAPAPGAGVPGPVTGGVPGTSQQGGTIQSQRPGNEGGDGGEGRGGMGNVGASGPADDVGFGPGRTGIGNTDTGITGLSGFNETISGLLGLANPALGFLSNLALDKLNPVTPAPVPYAKPKVPYKNIDASSGITGGPLGAVAGMNVSNVGLADDTAAGDEGATGAPGTGSGSSQSGPHGKGGSGGPSAGQGNTGGGMGGMAGADGPGSDGSSGSGGGTGGGQSGPGGCFAVDTLIQMKNGKTKRIQLIKIGDETKGGKVTAVMQFGPGDQAYEYEGVTVSATHPVYEDGKWVRIENSKKAIISMKKVDVWYDFNTISHVIYVKNIVFSDFAELDLDDVVEKALWELTLKRRNQLYTVIIE